MALAVGIDNDLIIVQHRFVAEPPLADVRSRSDQPQLLAVSQVVRGDHDVITHAEVDENPLVVRGGRARGIAVLWVDLTQLRFRPLPRGHKRGGRGSGPNRVAAKMIAVSL